MSDSNFQIHDVAWTPAKIRRMWAYFAGTPDADRKYFSSHSGDGILDVIQQHVSLNGTVLDYGCGPGYLSERLLRRGIHTTSLEFSKESCEQARKRCAGFDELSAVVYAENIPTPIPDTSIDVVLLIEVIEHLLAPELDSTVGEIHRVLKPGGTVVVTTPHNEDLDLVKTICPDCGSVFHPWQHVSSFTESSLSKVLAEGFKPEESFTTTFGMSAAGKAVRSVRGLFFGRGSLPPEPHLVFIGKKRS